MDEHNIPGSQMDTTTGGAASEPEAEDTDKSFREYVRKPNLPPHRTLSPGLIGEEAVLDEVSIITEGSSVEPVENMTVVVGGGESSSINEEPVHIDSENHSSEEELEEIITNKKPYVEILRDCKRKWTDLSQSDTSCDSDAEFEDPELRPGGSGAGGNGGSEGEHVGDDRSTSSSSDAPSGDEDQISHQPKPVEFSTSPPEDVHRPRRSLSPPPKLFGFKSQEQTVGAAVAAEARLGNFSSSLGDLSSLAALECDLADRKGKKTMSPRKRSRTTRVQHIQRPCLDFEKMQQVI